MKLMVNRTISNIVALFRRGHWWAEFWSGVVLMCWGTQNWITTHDIDVLPSYRVILKVEPEAFWEAAAITIGFAQIVTLVMDLRWSRLGTAFMASWFYGFITFGVLAAVGFVPSIPLLSGWVGINLFAIARLVAGLR